MVSRKGRRGARNSSPRRGACSLRVERLEDLMLLSFAAPVSYPAWYNAAGMVTEDLDYDGDADIVIANASLFPGEPNGRAGVLLNNGDGTFAAISLYEMGRTPSSVTVGDFDLDGYFDIAGANGNRGLFEPLGPGSVTVLFGSAEGWSRRYSDITVDWNTSSITQGDLNSDGYLDLLVTNVGRDNEPGTVMMLTNNGDGTFATPVVIHSGSEPDLLGPGWVLVNDFNADGLADLAISAGRGAAVSILLGNGDGSFAEPINHTIHTAPYTMRAGDFNGDGIVDLVAAHGKLLAKGDPRVSILIGNGDGTFGEFINHDIGTNPLGVIVGDFNGDGLDDIAVSNPPPSLGGESLIVEYALSNGDGTFTNVERINTGPAPLGLAVADFNLDGWLDLAVSHANPNIQGQPGSVAILLNQGDWAGPGGAPGVPGDGSGAGLAYLATVAEKPAFGLTTELPVAQLTPAQPEQSREQTVADRTTAEAVVETHDRSRVSLDALFGTDWLDSGFGG